LSIKIIYKKFIKNFLTKNIKTNQQPISSKVNTILIDVIGHRQSSSLLLTKVKRLREAHALLILAVLLPLILLGPIAVAS